MARDTKGDVTRDLSFECRCGAVTGNLAEVGPRIGDHVVCHCTDCQAFARRLGAAPWVLDGNAGTALYQSRCATMRIITGRDRLACLHLTDKPTLRWYARCCDTPMFNTYRNGRIPYITTVIRNCAPDRRVQAFGAPIGYLFLGEAEGDVRHLKPLSMATLMRRFLGRMLADIVTGDRRRSALFDPKTLRPIATPQRATGDAASEG